MARMVGYNAKYLSHFFKKEFGMGFAEYLRLLRINHAVILLENGVTSVKNVAALSGFSDPLYFSRVFTAAIGIPPKEYRKGISVQTEKSALPLESTEYLFAPQDGFLLLMAI